MSFVLLQSDGPLRTITLNDPERLNALDWPLLDELRDAVATVAADEHARALLVTGAGRAFCSGANVTNLFGDRTRPVDELREHLMKVYASFLPIRDLAIPTIAAVHGPAVGAGLNIALACDVIGADDALRLGIAQEIADDAQTRARDVALGWCERNPTLMAHVKQSLRVAATSDAATSLDVEAQFQAESLSSPEFERFAARFAKD